MSTPPGWYDDGSGRSRWWDGRQWTDHFAAKGEQPSSRHLWWALSPVYSCGAISFIPALHAAIRLQRRDLWFWAAALIAGNILALVLIGSGPSSADGDLTPLESLGAAIAVVVAAAGTIQAFRTREAVFAKDSNAPGDSSSGRTDMDVAIASSLAARERRVEAVALCIEDPSLARDLRIGRPDLTRDFDDGGLVDVNHAPEAILVSHLGLSDEQARAVVAARDHVGGFLNTDDLSLLAQIPPQVLDTIRGRIVLL